MSAESSLRRAVFSAHSHRRRAWHSALPLVAACGLSVQLGAATPPQVTALQKQVAANNKKSRELQKEKEGKEREIRTLQGKIRVEQSAIGTIQGAQRTVGRKSSAARAKLRDLDKKIARLRAPYELSVKWKAWKDANKSRDADRRRAAFTDMFRFAVGRPPNNSDLADMNLTALTVYRQHIAPKAIVPLAQALAGIGGLVGELVGIVSGGVSTVGAAIETVVEKVLMDEVMQPLNELQDELAREAHRSLYGTDDRAGALASCQRAKTATERLCQQFDAVGRRMNSAVNKRRGEITKLQGELTPLEARVRAIDEELQQLRRTNERITYGDIPNAYNAANMAQVQGTLYPTGVWVSGGGSLAADSLTAATTGLPRTGRFDYGASFTEYIQVPCQYTVRLESGQRVVRQTSVYTFRSPRGYLPPNGVSVAPEGSGISVSTGSKQVTATGPGRARLKATVSGALLERGWRTLNRPGCNREATAAKTGSLTRLSGGSFTVSKVVDYPVTRHNDVEDLWINGNPSSASLTGSVMLTTDGKNRVQRHNRYGYSAQRNAFWQVTSGSDVLQIHPRGSVCSVSGLTPGKGRLQAGLSDEGGTPHFVQNFDFTVSTVERDLAVRYPMEDFPYRAPIGEEFSFALTAHGGADMSKYEVQWHSSGRREPGPGLSYPKKTRFSRRGGAWVSEAKMRFTPAGVAPGKFGAGVHHHFKRDATRGFRPVARLVRKSDGENVAWATTRRGIGATLPRITRLQWSRVDDGIIPIHDLDLFFPVDKSKRNLGKFGVTLYHSAGKSTFPLHIGDTSMLGAARTALTWNGDQLALRTSRLAGKVNVPSSAIGPGLIDMTLDYMKALRQYGIVLGRDVLHDQLVVRVNKLVVNKTGEGPNAGYRLTVYGPTNCSNYTARWHLSQGGMKTSSLKPGTGGHVSELPAPGPKSYVNKVELVNGTGKVVAEYVPRRDGVVLDPPSLSLFAPDHKKIMVGQDHKVHAGLRSLKPYIRWYGRTDLKEFATHWHVDPAFGTFSPTETLPTKKLWWASTSSTLTVNNDPKLAGQRFNVSGSLMRKVAGTWHQIDKKTLELSIYDPANPPPTKYITPVGPVPPGGGPPGGGGPGPGVKVQFVRNLGGNNPFNQEEPVNNKDGQTYETTEEMLDDDGDEQQHPDNLGTGIIGVQTNWGMHPQTEVRYISVCIDPQTGAGQIFPDLSGSMIGFRSPPSTPPQQGQTSWIEVMEGVGGIWQFHPVSGIKYTVQNGTHTFRMQANTGLIADINVTITGGEGGRTLTVNSVTKVN